MKQFSPPPQKKKIDHFLPQLQKEQPPPQMSDFSTLKNFDYGTPTFLKNVSKPSVWYETNFEN